MISQVMPKANDNVLTTASRTSGNELFDLRLLVGDTRHGLIVSGLLVIAAAAGAAQLATGAGPREDLHLLYAVVAIGLIPLARSFVVGTSRREGLVITAAYLALGGLLFRLFTTA